MSRRIFIILLLLFAFANALPTPEDSSSSEESGEAKAISKDNMKETTSSESNESNELQGQRGELFFFTLHELGKITELGLMEAKKVAQGAVKDLSSVQDSKELLQKRLSNFTQFIDAVDKFESTKKAQNDAAIESLDIFANSSSLFEHYNATENKSLDTVDLLIALSLTKNGLDDLNTQLESQMTSFFKNFNEKMNEFVASLSPEARKEEENLVEWHNNTKNILSFETKLEKFGKFFELFVGIEDKSK